MSFPHFFVNLNRISWCPRSSALKAAAVFSAEGKTCPSLLCRSSGGVGGWGASSCKPRPWTMKAGPCRSFLCSHETPPSLMAVCTRNPSPSPPPAAAAAAAAAAAPIWSNALQRRNLTAQSVSDGKPILISRDKEREAIYSLHTSSPQRQSSEDLKFKKFMFLICDSASLFFSFLHLPLVHLNEIKIGLLFALFFFFFHHTIFPSHVNVR